MEKNIYGLLNEVKTDFNEYEKIELSSQEKEMHKQRILMEVKRMEKKKRNKKAKMWKAAAGAAAACVITVGAFSIVNPVQAQELFSSVFGKLIESAQGEKYEQEDTERYKKIGENAVAVQEEVDKRQGEEGYVLTTEHDGITISVSDVYCDGYVLYYTTTLQTDREDINSADGIILEKKTGEPYDISVNGARLSEVIRPFEKSADGTFVAIQQMGLMDPYQVEGDKETPIDLELEDNGTLVVDWTVRELIGKLWDNWDDQGEYQSTADVTGEWTLRFPVTVDKSQNETFDINKEENGILVKRGIKTKVGLILEVELPDFRQEPYNDKYNDPEMGIKGSDGKYIQWLSQKADLREDGTSTAQIMVLYGGQKDLSFCVTTRDEDQIKIADIAFQVP